MYLIFDTETTGIIRGNSLHPIENINQMPRMTEIGYYILDKNFNVIKEFESLIKPDGWEIPKEPFFIDAGFTTENNLIKGYPIAGVLDVFVNDLEMCEYIVAHNMLFDYRIVCAEMYRAGKRGKKLKKICTLKTAQNFFRQNGINSKCNLTDLHKFFFGVGFENSHNALADVNATAKVFTELCVRGANLIGM